jgi:hypothetical protein
LPETSSNTRWWRSLDLMLDRGDMEGRQVWLRIRRAIVQLQAAQIGPVH